MKLNSHSLQLVELAVAEDIGEGDITSLSTISADLQADAAFIAKEALLVCGHELVEAVFQLIDPTLEYKRLVPTAERVETSTVVATAVGPARSLLAAERASLNFLQRLSGIATMSANMLALVEGTGVRILDTRKTTPGWRQLEKFAVRTGGATNHRMGLFDAVMIKDNHIDAVGGDIRQAISASRAYAPAGTKIEVEVRDMKELALALEEAPDAILLDNMSPEQLSEAVSIVRAHPKGARVELEASGGITPDTIRRYAESGIVSISLGAITHSVPSVDISMKYVARD